MQRWHQGFLGLKQIPASISLFEVEYFFTLKDKEVEAIRTRRRALNRLGIALQIGFLRMAGRMLNSFETIPRPVLEHLGCQLHLVVPDITSIRALYRRSRTLFEHQSFAAQVLGFAELTEHAERGLTAHLRREAVTVLRTEALALAARIWLYQHRYVMPGKRRIAHSVRRALAHAEHELLEAIQCQVDASRHSLWLSELLKVREADGATALEWLREAPRGRVRREISEHLEKLRFLVALGMDRLDIPSLSLARLYHYAKPMQRRKPAKLLQIREPRRTLEVACFLRLSLLRTTDVTLELLDHRITDLWRTAKDRALATETQRLAQYRRFVNDVWALRADASLSGDDYRERLGVLLLPFEQIPVRPRAAAVRAELIAHVAPVRALLAAIRDIQFDLAEDHPLAIALPLLRTLYEGKGTRLPEDAANPFPPVWKPFIERDDRVAALAGYEVATLMLLKRSLRNGAASVDHSLSFRTPQRLLIPPEIWEKEHSRLYHDLDLPVSAETYLRSLRDTLQAGLAELAEAVQAGAVSIESGRIHLPRLPARPEAGIVKDTREGLYAAIGEVQLPDLILEVDSHTRFSWVLLGRSPKSERELITLYGALLAHGTDLSAAEVVRMIPGTSADSVSQLMRLLAEDSVLREANDRVVEFLRAHAIAQHWGSGLLASSDMMSLEATRHLWNARLDPRRRTYAIGTYTHVLDQWGIIYDQPIVLNRRQAGAALEGALRQGHGELERLAVDTHGFSHVAMALAKLLGFDLCPRLAHLSERKLYVPRGIDVPEVLRPVMEQVSTRAISQGWDALVRVAASTGAGWCPATVVLGWYGSAARGDPVFEAADALGKLQRTVYLCDYFGNPAFRREVLDVLNQGESVHDLQRAIHNGVIRAKRGRSKEELIAISGALALLTNIVMAFNTHRMQAVLDALPQELDPEALARIAPVHHAQINMRGIFTFSLARFRHRLFETPIAGRARRDRTRGA